MNAESSQVDRKNILRLVACIAVMVAVLGFIVRVDEAATAPVVPQAGTEPQPSIQHGQNQQSDPMEQYFQQQRDRQVDELHRQQMYESIVDPMGSYRR
mgnify:CR=1 FL=1